MGVGNKAHMVSCYAADVRRLHSILGSDDQLPKHTPVQSQLNAGVAKPLLRVVSWNINNLLGVDGASTVQPSAVLSKLERIGADVIILQECMVTSVDLNNRKLSDATSRVRELEATLIENGSSCHSTTCTNPTLLATKCQITYKQSAPLDESHEYYEAMLQDEWSDVRAALFAVVALGDARVAVVASHLHHLNKSLSNDGVRCGEMLSLLKHYHGNIIPSGLARTGALIVA